MAALAGSKASRVASSANGSSPPPHSTLPSEVVRRYRYGALASQIRQGPCHSARGCRFVAITHVDSIL